MSFLEISGKGPLLDPFTKCDKKLATSSSCMPSSTYDCAPPVHVQCLCNEFLAINVCIVSRIEYPIVSSLASPLAACKLQEDSLPPMSHPSCELS